MKRGRINKIWGIAWIVILIGFIGIITVREVLTNPSSMMVPFIIALGISIMLVTNGTISKTHELYNVWKDRKEIEELYEELEGIEETDFYTVRQNNKSIEISISTRERNNMIDVLIKKCDAYIHNANARKKLSKVSYQESMSTVKTIKSLAEKMKSP